MVLLREKGLERPSDDPALGCLKAHLRELALLYCIGSLAGRLQQGDTGAFEVDMTAALARLRAQLEKEALLLKITRHEADITLLVNALFFRLKVVVEEMVAKGLGVENPIHAIA